MGNAVSTRPFPMIIRATLSPKMCHPDPKITQNACSQSEDVPSRPEDHPKRMLSVRRCAPQTRRLSSEPEDAGALSVLSFLLMMVQSPKPVRLSITTNSSISRTRFGFPPPARDTDPFAPPLPTVYDSNYSKSSCWVNSESRCDAVLRVALLCFYD